MSALPPLTELMFADQPHKRVFLLGTAHVSEASVQDVQRAIAELDPDVVCVELDPGRFEALTDDERWKKLDIFKVLKERKTLYLLASLGLAAIQRRMGDQLGVKPGAELLAAVREAERLGKPVELIDRDVHITLKRTWASLSFFDKVKIAGGLLGGAVAPPDGETTAADIESLKDSANLSAMLDEFSRALPAVKRPLIDERDLYMVSKLREVKGERILAVVGAAHAPGMTRAVDTPVDRRALEALPPPAWWVKAAKWVIPTLIFAAFYWGWQKQAGRGLSEMLYAWILPNSILCAAMTGLALARLPSIATGFIASPFTSLNPMIPAGLVVGLVEAYLRRPTVQDAETLHEDLATWRGFYRNRFLRVLMVAVFATIGSAMGAWVGLGWVASLVGSQ